MRLAAAGKVLRVSAACAPSQHTLALLPARPHLTTRRLQVGDWLLFPSMGAYTLSGASKFNGMDATSAAVFYVCSHEP